MCNFCSNSTYSPKGTLRKYVRILPDILFPISETFFANGLKPPILVRMMSLLCEHKRHYPSQNIECSLYFCKKCFENLRMCNFCRTFAPCNESRRGERVG